MFLVVVDVDVDAGVADGSALREDDFFELDDDVDDDADGSWATANGGKYKYP